MRLETIPLIVGILVALVGLGFLADALLGDEASTPRHERRRRMRAERHRSGEAVLGIGILCMAAALVGRDSWRYSNIAVIAGTIAITGGALFNRVYLRELMMFRGPARRAAPEEEPPIAPVPEGRGRIR